MFKTKQVGGRFLAQGSKYVKPPATSINLLGLVRVYLGHNLGRSQIWVAGPICKELTLWQR